MNPHDRFWSADFKSAVSADFTIRAMECLLRSFAWAWDCRCGVGRLDALEETGEGGCGLGLDCGSEGVELVGAVLVEEGLGALHEGGLGAVLAEGFAFAVEDGADIEGDGIGGGQGCGAVGEEEVGAEIEEAGGYEGSSGGGEAFGGGGPVEGGGGEEGDHGVVGVGVEGSVSAEGEDDVWLEVADALDEAAGGEGEVGVFELGVLVVEELVAGDAKDLAGGGELGAAHLAEVLGGGGVAAVGGGLAVGETDDGGFGTLGGGEGEGATEGEALVVRMGDDAEELAAFEWLTGG